MKRETKVILFIAAIFILGLTGYLFYQYVDLSEIGIGTVTQKIMASIILVLALTIIVYIVYFIHGLEKNKQARNRNKLFESLVETSDTVYIMYDKTNDKYLYMTDNISNLFETKTTDPESDKYYFIEQIFQNPALKSQLDNWDGEKEFVSSMISYQNQTEKSTRWLKLKIYPFTEKKASYQVIVLTDATKEHDQQHMLITQASDIKTREQQLNQITASSYDIEMDVNIANGIFWMHNLKDGIHYFGEPREGDYQTQISQIIETFIEEKSQKEVTEILSLENFKKLAEENKLEPISLRYLLSNQKESIWLESMIYFTKDKGENHATIFTKNVTENAESIRKQNILLENALKDAKNANNAKSSFIKTMSHEIRTPMNAIIGLSQSALAEDLGRTVREDLESINSASQNVLEIIDGMLDIDKMEKGTLTLEEKEYKVPDLFRNLVNMAKERIGDKSITLSLDLDPTIPMKLYGDKGKIQQVLLNIIDNAVKFTEKGTITIKAIGKRKNSKANITISVSDTGVGIKPEELEHLFDEKNSDGKQSNTGLSITKKIIDSLHSSLTAESEFSKGSTFTISVDQRIMDEQEIGDLNDYILKKRNVASFNAEGSSILLVDDNKLNLKVATRLLEPYNAFVESANSGQKCIELIASGKKFDLILLDQMMPEMNGIETLHELKKIAGFATPVIMLTADAIVGMKEKYLQEGFDDYLSKPIDTSELHKILKKYLQK